MIIVFILLAVVLVVIGVCLAIRKKNNDEHEEGKIDDSMERFNFSPSQHSGSKNRIIRFNKEEKETLLTATHTIRKSVRDLENDVLAHFLVRVVDDTGDRELALEVKEYCEKRVGPTKYVSANDSPVIMSMKFIINILDRH